MKLHLRKASQLIEKEKGQAPTAFRIWKFGNNKTDYGDSIFNEVSAKAIIGYQNEKKIDFSIDWNHMSLSDVALPESTGAAGWHNLEVRQDNNKKPELWAINVKWSKEAKEGLEADPPKWKYFSPAYYQDDNNVITGYVNMALCINPATYENTKLASTKQKIRKTNMDMKALQDIIDSPDSTEEEKAAAELILKKLQDQMESAVDEEKSPDSEKAEEAKKMAEKSDEPEFQKTSKKASASELSLAKKVAELEAKIQDKEVKELVQANLGKRIPASLKGWAEKQDIDTLNDYLKSAPVLSGSKEVKANSGSIIRGDKDSTVKTAAQSEIDKHLDKVLGVRAKTNECGLKSEGAVLKLSVMTPSEWREVQKQKV